MSLEPSAAVGLDELNYDLFWDHLEVAQDMEQEVTGEEEESEEEETKEVVAEEEEVVEVTEASSKVPGCRTHQKEYIALCDAWYAISMDAMI